MGNSIFPLQLLSILLPLAFELANCRGYISLSQAGSVCSNFTVLSCSFRNVIAVRLQDFDSEDNRFNTLSSNRIARNPDYEASSGDDVYELRIRHPERYNGSLYRCFGFDEDIVAQYSNQWKLSIPTKDVCTALELNVTDTAAEDTNLNNVTDPEDTNATRVTNQTKQGGADHKSGHMPARISALFSIFAVLPIIAVLVVAVNAVLCALRVQRKNGGVVDSDDVPMAIANNPDVLVSADQSKPQATDRSFHQEISPDTSLEVAPMPGNPAYEPTFTSAEMSRQAPQLEKISETELSGVINVPMQGNPAYEAIGTIVQWHPPHPRTSAGLEQSQDVHMQSNPAYEPVGATIPSTPIAAQVQTHLLQPSAGAGLLAHDVPMQGNPAYEPITPAQVQAHQLELSTGAVLSEDVRIPMQGNPAYETFALALVQARPLLLGLSTGAELPEDVPMQGNPAYEAVDCNK